MKVYGFDPEQRTLQMITSQLESPEGASAFENSGFEFRPTENELQGWRSTLGGDHSPESYYMILSEDLGIVKVDDPDSADPHRGLVCSASEINRTLRENGY